MTAWKTIRKRLTDGVSPCGLSYLSVETKEAKILLVLGIVREIKPLLVQLQKLPVAETEQSIRNILSLLLFLSPWVL